MTRRLRLALPFSILTAPDVVRLVAGEDQRYTLTAPGLERWLPELLRGADGRRPLEALLDELPAQRRAEAAELVERLVGERVLAEGPPELAHAPLRCALAVHGTGPLAERLRAAAQPGPDPVHVLVQDRMDWAAARTAGRRFAAERAPWLWASTGALARAYVSPPFLPGPNACFECLRGAFVRLSPAPELYAHLEAHVAAGGALAAVDAPPHALAVLQGLVEAKLAWLASPDPQAALYRLHVLELASYEVTTHRLFRDPRCADCGERA